MEQLQSTKGDGARSSGWGRGSRDSREAGTNTGHIQWYASSLCRHLHDKIIETHAHPTCKQGASYTAHILALSSHAHASPYPHTPTPPYSPRTTHATLHAHAELEVQPGAGHRAHLQQQHRPGPTDGQQVELDGKRALYQYFADYSDQTWSQNAGEGRGGGP